MKSKSIKLYSEVICRLRYIVFYYIIFYYVIYFALPQVLSVNERTIEPAVFTALSNSTIPFHISMITTPTSLVRRFAGHTVGMALQRSCPSKDR